MTGKRSHSIMSKQVIWFHFGDEKADGFIKLNEFLQSNKILDIQCTNNGYGSHVYVIYEVGAKVNE